MQQVACLFPGHPAGAGHVVEVDGLATVFLLGLGEGAENLLVLLAVVRMTGECPLRPALGRNVPAQPGHCCLPSCTAAAFSSWGRLRGRWVRCFDAPVVTSCALGA